MFLGCLPLTGLFYFPLAAAAMPPEADSAAIPIVGLIMGTVMLVLPLMFLTTWLALGYEDPSTRWLDWDANRPGRSFLATLAFGTPAALILWFIFDGALISSAASDLLWLPCLLLLLVWLETLRSFAIGKGRHASVSQ